jgi:hypothetical protein
MKELRQGYLDSLCGIYSIVNADRIVNKPSFNDSQVLFNRIIDYLHDEGILRSVIIEGVNQALMKNIIREVADDKFPLQITNKRGIIKLNDWWKFSREFLEEKGNRAIILSMGGKFNHLTTVYRMTQRRLFCMDSTDGESTINKSFCRIVGYTETDKYIIYPSQCWYVGKE